MVKPGLFFKQLLLLPALLLALNLSAYPDNTVADLARRRLDFVQDLKLEIQGAHAVVSGKVRNYFEKRAAERTLLKLLGVDSVSNNIMVNPIARTDSQIKTDINTVLQSQAWLNPRKLVVKVAKHIVTLDGSVERLPEKDLIEEIAGSIRGVREIINQIKVIPPSKYKSRASDVVRQEVEAALLAELGETVRKAITVELNGGTVALRGVVRHYYEKLGAYQAASSVPDVLAVKNLLEIE